MNVAPTRGRAAGAATQEANGSDLEAEDELPGPRRGG